MVMKIGHSLHAKEIGSKHLLPAAPHTLSKVKKQTFCHRLFELKLPDGYASNISKCIHLNVENCEAQVTRSSYIDAKFIIGCHSWTSPKWTNGDYFSTMQFFL